MTTRLRKHEFLAVNDVSFQLRRGECIGVLGLNGSGKSTLLKLLAGLIKPDAGRVAVRGRVSTLVDLAVGFHPLLTGRENVMVSGAILGLSPKEVRKRLSAIEEFAGIGDFLDAPFQSYSSGMKVRLGFSVATQMNPQVLIIDEVLAVGDLGFRQRCYDFMGKAKQRGMSIVLVSHMPFEIERLSDRVAVMSSGRMVYDGDLKGGTARYQRMLAGEPEPPPAPADEPSELAGVA